MNYIILSVVLLIVPLLLSILTDMRFSPQVLTQNFVLMNLCQALWLLFVILFYSAPDSEWALYFVCLKYLAISFFPVFLSLHVMRILKNTKPTKQQILILCIIPTIVSIMAITNPLHHLFFTELSFIDQASFLVLRKYGPFYYLHLLFSYGILTSSFFKLLKPYFLLPEDIRKPLFQLLTGISTVIITSFMSVFVLGPLPFDLTLFASSFALICFYFSLQVATSANILVTSKEKIYNNLQNIIFVLNLDGYILDYNEQASKHFSKIITPPFTQYKFETFLAIWFRKENGRVSPYNKNILILERNFKEYHFLLYEQDVIEDDLPVGTFIEILEITEVYDIFRLLEESAYYDNLTGLHNKNSYLIKVEEWAGRDMLPLAIIIGDVNRLKLVNDTFGHLAGDSLLRDVADIIKAYCPPDSFMARIGGDEYIILIPNSSQAEMELTMENIQSNIDAHENPMYGSPSLAIGGLLRTTTEEHIEDLIRLADEAMYRDKHDRRRSVKEILEQQLKISPAEILSAPSPEHRRESFIPRTPSRSNDNIQPPKTTIPTTIATAARKEPTAKANKEVHTEVNKEANKEVLNEVNSGIATETTIKLTRETAEKANQEPTNK